ncbi:MAG: Ig-like domain-containing protein [Acidobacteriota bacterium]|nr:Ig-like domain-containing protein [Acidobacteriota bacterium]
MRPRFLFSALILGLVTLGWPGLAFAASVPDARDDQVSGSPGQSFLIDVLANDTDADGKALYVVDVTTGCAGTVTNLGDGTLLYESVAGESSCQITYSVTDTPNATGVDDTAVVVVDFPFSDPVFLVNDTLTVPAGTSSFDIADLTLLANDQPEGDLRIISFTPTAEGSLARNGADDGFVYQPAASFWTVGQDGFTYTAELISDPSQTGTGSVTLIAGTAGDPPDAVDDGPLEVSPDDLPFYMPNDLLLDNDSPAGDIEIISAGLEQPPVHGNLSAHLLGWTYSPTESFWTAGGDSFSYTIRKLSDPEATDTATVTLVALPDPPEAFPDSAVTTRDQSVEIDLLANDTGTAIVIHDLPQSPGFGAVENLGAGVVRYTPGAGETGTDGFTYRIRDAVNQISPAAAVDVTVLPFAAFDDALEVPQGLEGRLIPAFELLTNDLLISGSQIVAVTAPTHGSLVPAGLDLPGAYVYQPAASFWTAGSDSFVYTLESPSYPGVTVSATVTLDAGAQAAVFEADHEEGDLSDWDTLEGGTAADAAASLVGNTGLGITLNGHFRDSWAAATLPQMQNHLHGQWVMDLAAISGQEGRHGLFELAHGASPVLTLQLVPQSVGHGLRLVAQEDAGEHTGLMTVVPGGPRIVAVEWWAAAEPGADDGGYRLWVDGSLIEEVTNLDNDEQVVDRVRSGGLRGSEGYLLGALRFDHVQLWRGSGSFVPLFADGAESGDLAAWSSTAAPGKTSIGATAAAALDGVFGIATTFEGTTHRAYVEDDSPSNAQVLSAFLRLDPNSIGLAAGTGHVILQCGRDATDQALQVKLYANAGGYLLRFQARLDDGSWALLPSGGWVSLSDAPHTVRLDWRASFFGGADNGEAQLWVDGVSQGAVTGLANASRAVDSCRLGAVVGVDASTSGTLYLDDYRAWR